jgi:hypothetical protein
VPSCTDPILHTKLVQNAAEHLSEVSASVPFLEPVNEGLASTGLVELDVRYEVEWNAAKLVLERANGTLEPKNDHSQHLHLIR